MSFVQPLLVPVIALATLFVGVLEAAATHGPRVGIMRAEPCDLDAAALETSIDAEADTDDDDSLDGSWDAIEPTPAELVKTRSRLVLAHADAVPRLPLLATSSVRGPPARG